MIKKSQRIKNLDQPSDPKSLSRTPKLCRLPWAWPEGLADSRQCPNLDEYSKSAIMTSAVMSKHMDKNSAEFKKCPG